MKLLLTVLSLILMALALNAVPPLPERTHKYFLLSWPYSDTLYRVNYPDLDEFEPLPDYPELRERASDWKVTGTHDSKFIIAVFLDHETRFYLLDPESKELGYLITLYARRIEYKCKHRHFHFFESFDRTLHILDTEKLIFYHHQLKHTLSTISHPDEDGYFYGLASNSITAGYDQVITQYRISEAGFEETGFETLLRKGDLAEWITEGSAGITDFGPGYLLLGGIFDIESGESIGATGDGGLIQAGDAHLLKYNRSQDQLVMRSLDGSRQSAYPTDGDFPAAIIDAGDAYHAYYAGYNTSAEKVLSEQVIPKLVAGGSTSTFPEHQYPRNPLFYSSIAPMDASSFMYQIPLPEGGLDVAVVNIPERKVEGSVWINKPLRHTPFFDESNNSLWFQGYELLLRESGQYQLNWGFDASAFSLGNFFRLGDNIYFQGFPTGYFNLTNREPVASAFPITRSDNLLVGSSGNIYVPRGLHMEVYASEQDFQDRSFQLVETPFHATNSWISNQANTLWVNGYGQLFRNEDIQNLFTLDPYIPEDLETFNPIAVHGEKIYRLSKSPSLGGPSDEVTHLHIWNNDGSQQSRITLSPGLIAPFYDEITNGINWDIFTTGNQLYLLASIGDREAFLFDFDEQTGEVLGLEDPSAARITYLDSYDSYLYGRIHEVNDNWKYSPDDEWMFLREQKDHYIEWSDYYGFVARPKYSSTYLYDYDEGWKAWLEERSGYDWYYDFKYKYRESTFPSLAPAELTGRHIHVYDSLGGLIEYWNVTSESSAELSFLELVESGPYQIPITYLNPHNPNEHTVRVEFNTENFLNVSGFYEFTFLTKFEGNLRSDLTVPDPDRPGWYINFKAEGTFRIVTPDEGPVGN